MDSNIIENINQLRKNRKFTDAIIITKDNTSIAIHRNIIAPVSSYFEQLFERNNSNIIQLNIDISGYLLNILIDFIYTGIIDITYENGKALNKYAKIFCIKNLEKSTQQLLIDNLNDETCLEYWRHAEEMENEYLKIKCLGYILENPEDFFQFSLFDLTFQELESIISNEEISCTQETLYKTIIQWIKKDYHRRHNHLAEFFRSIRISTFTIPFINKEILNDEILFRNNDIPNEILQYFKDRTETPIPYNDLYEKLFACINNSVKLTNFCNLMAQCNEITKTYVHQANAFTEMASNLQIYDEKIFNSMPQNERILNFGKVYAYEIDLPNKIISPISKLNKSVFHAVSAFRSHNVLISGGGYFFGTRKCKLYDALTNKFQPMPSMYEGRIDHRLINLNDDQIYACGGDLIEKSVEYYDVNKGCWLRCLNGMNQKSTNFGLINNGHCLYAFGGDSSNNIEHYDPRIGIWRTLKKNTDITGTTRATCVNDYVYCFCKRFGKIYDIRQNDWIEGILYPFNGVKTSMWQNFDVIESNNLIYIFGNSRYAYETLYAYDYEEKHWTLLDINIPKIRGIEINLVKLPKTLSNRTLDVREKPLTESTSSRKFRFWKYFKRNSDENQENSNKPIPTLLKPQFINDKLIFISHNWLYKLNFNTKKLEPILKNYFAHLFSTCNFKKNYILIAGGVSQCGANICKYYCDTTQEIKEFPSLIDNRIQPKTIELYDKIYACSGWTNNKFCEIFDEKSEKWSRSSERMIDKVYNFGITTYGGCIYTFGGMKDTKTNPSNTVEQFDPRIGKWTDLKNNSKDLGQVHCCTINNRIYCFDRQSLHTFDVRKNQWLSTIPHTDEIFINFCIAEVDGQILMIGQIEEGENCMKIFNTENSTLEKIDFDVPDILLANMNLIKILNN